MCHQCCLAPTGGVMNCWRPVDGISKHPVAEALKRQAKDLRLETQRAARLNRSPAKVQMARRARRAEVDTHTDIIRATINSGRKNNDADSVHWGRITLDTKLQSTRDNPEVSLQELDRVREDARRAGNPFGGLVLRNRQGRAVVVFDLADYARLVARIAEEQE